VRHAGATLAAAVVTGGAGIAVALLSMYRLADAPIRGRLAGPDPLGSLASAIALVVGVVAFYRLGVTVAADTTSARAAILAGAVGGTLAGLAVSVAQSFALSDYLSAVLAGYAVPAELLAFVLGAYVALATIAAAVIAAGISYAGWSRAHR
jgi:hypothetical protein